MNLFLIVEKGKQKGMPIPVKTDLFLMGSDRVCQLRVQHPRIGSQHCALVTRDDKVFVRDLNSGCATLVNDKAVPPGGEWPLHAGDHLTVGPLQAMVNFSETALSQRNAEEWALKTLDTVSRKNDDRGNSGEGIPGTASGVAAAILGKLGERRGEVRGRLRVALEKGVTVIRLNDTHLIDEAEISLLKNELFEQVGRTAKRTLLDLQNVQRMSSMAIGVIMGFYRQLRAQGIAMALCHVSPELLPILQTVGMGKIMPCFPDKATALAAPW